ncbi:acyl carrier protein [Streptomyces sp. NPDC001719]
MEAARTAPVLDRDGVKKLLAERLRVDVAALTEETTLDELGLDSLLLAETMAAAEDTYDVVYDMEVIANEMVPSLPLGAFLDLLADTATLNSPHGT